MKNHLLGGAAALLLLCTACQKQTLSENLSTPAGEVTPAGYVQYLIPKGEHYANGNTYKPVDVTAMRFTVRFDSSCIYQTIDPQNQWDINKLYGFADNGALHQDFSARIGWRWSEGALRLFAYTYNNAVRESKEIAAVPIGQDLHCGISILKDAYVFTVEEKSVTMPRQSTTATAKGYQLYPYFGGDEAAPHDVRIWIRNEQ
jgi:hypothetical protein